MTGDDASMETKPSATASSAKPYQHLIRSKRIEDLWVMRILIRHRGLRCFTKSPQDPLPALDQLRIHSVDPENADQLREVVLRLRATLPEMERRRQQFVLSGALKHNLQLMGKVLGMSMTEQRVLALAILLCASDGIRRVSEAGDKSINIITQVARVIGSPTPAVMVALAPGSRLLRSGLINVRYGGDLNQNLSLARASLRRLAYEHSASVQDMFRGLVRAGDTPQLSLKDYAHLSPPAHVIIKLLAEALDNQRAGVNILLYGPPGTGKTEFARVLADANSAASYEVSATDIDGDPIAPRHRLSGAAVGQLLLSRQRAVLVFDEIDAIFNDGSDLFGKPTTAETAKCWVNDLLERNPTPAVWIANRIWNMDRAFLRRFDLVIHMDAMPLGRREHLLEQTCGSFLTDGEIRRLAQVESVTPAVLKRAASVIARLEVPDKGKLMEEVLDGVLLAQGHAPIRRACQTALPEEYDVNLCNADIDLAKLCNGLKARSAGRICLYGAPGTGKTAFGLWLAQEIGRPLILKRVSDLQSPWLGEMERNLARAFDQASRDNAVLQIDEVDSFLQNRSQAQRGWEVSQVNEFLTQLESFDGVFIASTNLMGDLDPAAMRRFDFKICMHYLQSQQAKAMLLTQLAAFGIKAPDATTLTAVGTLDRLTPGDFAITRRQHRITPFSSASEVIEALQHEQRAKLISPRRIGFL